MFLIVKLPELSTLKNNTRSISNQFESTFPSRNYVKQRAAIEKQYADSLLKLSHTFQNHRIAPIPDVNNLPAVGPNGQQQQAMQVWKMNIFLPI